MSEMPAKWSEVPIGSFARVIGGGTPPSKDPANFAPPGKGIPWLTPADLSGYQRQSIERGARDLTPTGFAACGATLLPKGSVLFSSRAPIGYVAIAANEISTNQGFKSFVLPVGFDSRFCYYQLKHLKPLAESIATGTTFKELSGAATATLPFRVAPINEQTRIADQLDTLLARVKACNDHLDAIPALLKRFRQAVMNAAIRGDLVQDRADRGSQSRSLVSIPDLCLKQKHAFGIGPFGSDLKVADYRESGVPLVFVREIRARKFGDRTTKFVSLEKAAQLSAHRVLPGDLLITKMGDPPGDSAIYPAYGPPAVMTADVVRMRIDPDVADARFVSYWFESEVGRSLIATITAGVAQQKISLERLRTLQIKLPNIDEQKTTIQQVESLLELAGRIESAVLAAGARAQRLNSLTLAKAFRGELVPQDPNDEAASDLLARLKTGPTSAAATPARKRSKATGERPKMSNVDQNSIKTVILKLETDRFSFDELKAHAAGDYESLKTALFALLEEPNPVVRQIFDEDAKVMRLVRVKP